MDIPAHIAAKIDKADKTDNCWLWTGELSSNGYGRCWYKGIRQSAHRVINYLITGKAHEGKQLDHHCCVRNCVNPDHLTPVTGKMNCKLREKRKKKNV